MAYEFWTETVQSPEHAVVLDALPEGALYGEPHASSTGRWRTGEVRMLAMPSVSTRGVELEYDGVRFRARLLACACPADYGLALSAVCAVAAAEGGAVESDDGVRFHPADRETYVGTEWVRRHATSVARAVLAVARRSRETGSMEGPTRTFLLGPHVMSEIDRARADDEGRAQELFRRMRALMWLASDVQVARVMHIAGVHRSERLSIWTVGVKTLLSPVEKVTVLVRSEPIQVPFEAIEEVAGAGTARRIDEAHVLLEAVGSEQKRSIARRAREACRPEQREPSASGSAL
jgi:hypothetical protein